MTEPGRRLAVPAYFHPAVAGDHWRRLSRHSAALRAIVLNVDSGPGAVPELELLAAAGQVRAPILGYVDTDYGARPLAVVAAELARYRQWYPTTGVFLDRVATAAASLPWYERLIGTARGGGAELVVLNHGAYPDPGYAVLADAVVTFEGPYAAYRRLTAPPWVRGLPADRFWHLVYDTAPELLPAALRHAEANHAGVRYVTDRAGANPWDGLPSYFPSQAGAGPCD